MSGIYTSVLVYAAAANDLPSVAAAHKAQLLQTQKLVEARELRHAQYAQNAQKAAAIGGDRANVNIRAIQNLLHHHQIASTSARGAADGVNLSYTLTAQTAFKAQQISQQGSKRSSAATEAKSLLAVNNAAKAYQSAVAISPTSTRAFSGTGLVILNQITKIDVFV